MFRRVAVICYLAAATRTTLDDTYVHHPLRYAVYDALVGYLVMIFTHSIRMDKSTVYCQLCRCKSTSLF